MSNERPDSLPGLQMQISVTDYTFKDRRDQPLQPDGYGAYESTFEIQTEAAVEVSDKELFEAVVKSKILKATGDALEANINKAMKEFGLDRGPRKGLVKSAPGSRLNAWTSNVLPKKTYERLVVQTILDEREEYFEALSKDQELKARWIAIRLWLIVISNIVLTPLFSAVAKLFPRPPSL